MRRSLAAAGVAALLAWTAAAAVAGTDWPLMPPDQDHPIGNTFGEYLQSGSDPPEQHLGLDILGNPRFQGEAETLEDYDAPYSYTVQSGRILPLINIHYRPGSTSDLHLLNEVRILGDDGKLYRYLHHAYNSFHPDFVKWYNTRGWVPEGVPICMLVRWPDCSPRFNHLHFEVRDGSDTTVLNPNTGFLDEDYKAPKCEGIGFAKDDKLFGRWTELSPAAPGASPVVSGEVDIVIKARDENAAGSTSPATRTLWVKNVRWKVCPESTPSCSSWNDTYAFNSMPEEWGNNDNSYTKAYFSGKFPWASSTSYCGGDPHYAVVTNFKSGLPDEIGNWSTAGLAPGSYTVTVELTDFAGNSSFANARVLVENPRSDSTTELTIRDGEGDTGAVPFLGGNWWQSPDITVNPGTAIEDRALRIGAENTVDVRVWNLGSAPLAAGTIYSVSLGWSTPATTVPYPLAAPAKRIDTKAVSLSAPFKPGSSEVTTFKWTPTAADFPGNAHSLVAWVEVTGDPVMNTSSVHLDDNRAQQDLREVVTAPLRPAVREIRVAAARLRIEARPFEGLPDGRLTGDDVAGAVSILRDLFGGLSPCPVGGGTVPFTH